MSFSFRARKIIEDFCDVKLSAHRAGLPGSESYQRIVA